MARMLSQISTVIDYLSRSIFFGLDSEKATTDEQGPEIIDARLPEVWFADIPHCTLRCLYGPALTCGCAYSDFQCICTAFSEIGDNEDIETCINACPHNEDGHWAPDRILDFCQLVIGDEIKLPDYMDQYAGPHRRQAYPISDPPDDSGPYYSDFSYYDYSTGYEPSATTFITTSEPTTASPIITWAPTASYTTWPFHSSPPIPSPGSSGLSTGAKAGIGVAVPLAVIIIALGLFWYRRKRRENAPSRNDGNNDLPDVSEQPWSKKIFQTSRSPPAEADSNAIHESDSKPVLPSPHLRGSSTSSPSIVYELSGQPSIRAPRPAFLASHKRDHSMDQQSSERYSVASDGLPRKVVGSPVSLPDSEAALSGGATATTLENASTTLSTITTPPPPPPPASLQSPSADTRQRVDLDTDTELQQLEAEIARVREQRERLQHLQLLEEREEQLRKEIAARKSGRSAAE